MKITPLGIELIDRLRNDEHTRQHFGITLWEGRNTCGTVGCIAGTAIAMKYQFDPIRPWTNQFNEICDYGILNTEEPRYLGNPTPSVVGARLIGLDEKTSEQVFTPLLDWFEPLRFEIDLFDYLGANQKPSAEYVEELKQWARTWNAPHRQRFTPDACARVLELLHEGIPYVDWKRAHKEA